MFVTVVKFFAVVSMDMSTNVLPQMSTTDCFVENWLPEFVFGWCEKFSCNGMPVTQKVCGKMIRLLLESIDER